MSCYLRLWRFPTAGRIPAASGNFKNLNQSQKNKKENIPKREFKKRRTRNVRHTAKWPSRATWQSAQFINKLFENLKKKSFADFWRVRNKIQIKNSRQSEGIFLTQFAAQKKNERESRVTKVGFTRFPLAPHIQMSNQSPQSVEFQKEDPQQMSCCRAGNSLGLSTPDRLPTEISGECVAIGCDDTPPLASVEMKNDTTQNERSTFTQLTSQGGSTFREWGGSLTAGRRGGSDDSAAARSTHSRHTDIPFIFKM
jgi:hypothetical protein